LVPDLTVLLKRIAMGKDANLEFIREKINQVQSAIMYSSGDEEIRLPNNIVSAVKVDEEGQLWFVCDRPSYLPEVYPSSFPARLHFYRKGKLFHIEVSGPARIVNNKSSDNASTGDRMLIKMEMKNITYTETPSKQKNGMEQWLAKASRWMHHHFGHAKPSRTFIKPLLPVERN